jgi:hypothetical protein
LLRTMIVWINGAFGSGKTTVVEALRLQRPDAVVFDPEYIGYVLREFLPVPTGDFQDLAAWREIVSASVTSINRHHADLLLVPMTLVHDDYRRETFDAIRTADAQLLEVFLDVPRDELRRRIDRRVLSDDPVRDAAARAFCISKIDECTAAAGRLGPDTLVLDAGPSSPSRLAEMILERI